MNDHRCPQRRNVRGIGLSDALYGFGFGPVRIGCFAPPDDFDSQPSRGLLGCLWGGRYNPIAWSRRCVPTLHFRPTSATLEELGPPVTRPLPIVCRGKSLKINLARL